MKYKQAAKENAKAKDAKHLIGVSNVFIGEHLCFISKGNRYSN